MYHYTVIRADLPHGLQVAENTHAAGESARLAQNLPADTHAVALQVPTEAALLELGQALDSFQIPHVKIYENDAPYENQLMAIGVVPAPRTPQLRKLTARLKKIE